MNAPTIGLIWVQSDGGIIGSNGTMPWHLPEDLAHFKQVTLGHPVVMGRKSWESLPAQFRPLPGRKNIVLTRQAGWQAEGAEVAHSVDAALAAAVDAAGSGEVWVIGGAEIFGVVIDRADRLEVTEIAKHFNGDTTAPSIGHRWRLRAQSPEEGWHSSRTGLDYRFLSYAR